MVRLYFPEEFYASHFLGQILVCVSTISQPCQILISSAIPSGTYSHPVMLTLVLLLLLLFYFFRVFHICDSLWVFAEVRVIASLVRSPAHCGSLNGLDSSPDFQLFQSSYQTFGIVFSAPIGISVTRMFQSFFNSLATSKNLFVFSLSLIFTLWSAGTENSTRWHFFLISPRSVLLTKIRWFWFMHVPFGSIVKSWFLTQFPVNHLSYPVVLSLVFLLC